MTMTSITNVPVDPRGALVEVGGTTLPVPVGPVGFWVEVPFVKGKGAPEVLGDVVNPDDGVDPLGVRVKLGFEVVDPLPEEVGKLLGKLLENPLEGAVGKLLGKLLENPLEGAVGKIPELLTVKLGNLPELWAAAVLRNEAIARFFKKEAIAMEQWRLYYCIGVQGDALEDNSN